MRFAALVEQAGYMTVTNILAFPSQRGAFVSSHEPWVTKREAGRVLCVSTRTIDRWIAQGLPEATVQEPGAWRYIGHRRHFQVSRVLAWMAT